LNKISPFGGIGVDIVIVFVKKYYVELHVLYLAFKINALALQ